VNGARVSLMGIEGTVVIGSTGNVIVLWDNGQTTVETAEHLTVLA